jgi:hypothetical protein
LGSEYSSKLEQLWRYKQPFKFNIIIDCRRLLEDFHEDLEFHFSFGVDALLRRIIAFMRGRPVTSIGRDHFAVALVIKSTFNLIKVSFISELFSATSQKSRTATRRGSVYG